MSKTMKIVGMVIASILTVGIVIIGGYTYAKSGTGSNGENC